MNCSTCKFWKSAKERGYEKDGWGICGKADSDQSGPEDQLTLAYAVDPYDYGASLLTNKNFGCVMHEKLNSIRKP